MRRVYEPIVMGIGLLALLILVESIQLVIVLGLISSFVPFGADPFHADLFPVFVDALHPNRQMLVYHIFIMTCILGQAIGIYAFRRKLEDAGFQNNIKLLLCADSLWVFIQTFAIFKILIYNGQAWGWGLFYISLAASMLSRIFWVEIKSGWLQLQAWLLAGAGTVRQTVLDDPITWDEFLWIPLFVIVESLQVVIGFNFIWGQAKEVAPLFSYGVFIFSIGLCSALVWKRIIRLSQMKGFIIAETLITFLLSSALFKIIIYDYRNQLATNAYHVLLVLAVLNKILWPLLGIAGRASYMFLMSVRNTRSLRVLGDCFMVALIAALLYLTDPQAVLAKMFVGEQLYHVNSFVMSSAWAYVSGCMLDVDVTSHYGFGVPIVLSTLTKCFGGFSYLNMLLVFMWSCIVYFALCYVFLRVWLKSFALAAAAILIGIKAQMFFTLTLPQTFTYPNGTPVRFMFDILFIFSIWMHLCKQRWIYLWLAALSCAFSIFYMMETGLYLTMALYGYLFMYVLMPTLRRKMFASVKGRVTAALCVLSVPLGALLFIWFIVGRHVLENQFWFNVFEFGRYATTGLNLGPFYGGLQFGQFWDLFIGFLFPIVFILTILIVGTLCVLEKISPKHLMVIVLCIYGLGQQHYYIAMPTANNYYTRALPFVFVVFYWMRLWFAQLSSEVRMRLSMALVAFCAYALFTNHHYLSYPNIFNFSRNPMVDPLVAEELPTRKPYLFHKVWDCPEALKLPLNSLGEKDEGLKRDFASDEELKAYYRQENDYSKDVRLIQSLTGPRQPVALVSSFATEILMQADRKPLFYYSHFLPSRPLRMRSFPTSDEIYTTKELQKLIDELQTASSPYVFMERIFLASKVPDSYAHDLPGLMGVLAYVKGHYEPYSYGKFLVALKRRSSPRGEQ